ncbi:MAG TPA: VanZ family protein [Gemmatimonadaceae bacterium]|nr:VanZ family protein [Gemmatimonadaceae bacterium]
MRFDAGARLKVRRWLPPLLWAGVILFVTSVPGNMLPQEVSPYDKLVHLTIYGLFAVLLTRDLSQVTTVWRAALFALTIAVAFGAADEWHQQFIPRRDADVTDWVADSTGAALGASLFVLFSWFRRSKTPITQ